MRAVPADEEAAPELRPIGEAEPLIAGDRQPGSDAVSSAAERVQELETELAKARDAEATLLREFRNYRRHAEAELAKVTSGARVQLLAELADTVQALELASSAADTDPASVRDGIGRVARNLQKVFERHGLQRIAAQGVAFDPALHEAVLIESVSGVEKGTVVREISPGFRTDEEVIRPAKVSVAA